MRPLGLRLALGAPQRRAHLRQPKFPIPQRSRKGLVLGEEKVRPVARSLVSSKVPVCFKYFIAIGGFCTNLSFGTSS